MARKVDILPTRLRDRSNQLDWELMKATILIVLAAVSGCNSGIDVVPRVNCAVPTPGFHSFHTPNFTERWPVPIDGYHPNIVKVTKSGAITWNGVDLATKRDGGETTLETYMTVLKSYPFQPITALDFDAGAPCAKIITVRKLMIKHLRCSEVDSCFQGTP